jgi:HPt (histidine-containing phosphotransfer) domain-containing protein
MEAKKDIPVNMAQFKEIANEELELAASLIDTFLKTCPEEMELIARFSKSGEAPSLYQATHKLNNSLKVIGAEKAVEVSIEIERRSKKSELDGIASNVAQLEKQVDILKAYFQKEDWKKDFASA